MAAVIVKQENVIAAYQAASDEGKALLKALFPSVVEEQPKEEDVLPIHDTRKDIKERIKTFEDACTWHGVDPEALKNLWEAQRMMPDEVAYQKLRLIVSALNEGWEPAFTTNEWRYYPWHYLYTQTKIDEMATEEQHERCTMSLEDYKTEGWAGFACASSNYAPSRTSALLGSRLCLKNRELATYCGTQFIRLWADFKLIRK